MIEAVMGMAIKMDTLDSLAISFVHGGGGGQCQPSQTGEILGATP